MTLLLVNMLFVHVCLCYGIALHEVTTCFVSAFVACFNTSETLCKSAVYCQKTFFGNLSVKILFQMHIGKTCNSWITYVLFFNFLDVTTNCCVYAVKIRNYSGLH